MKKLLLLLACAMPLISAAQDDLVKKLDANKSDSAKKKFVFKKVINLETTSVKNQASSGTCWSYSTNSFLESEMLRMGKKPVELSQIFSARNEYMDKADTYVRLHGGLSWGDGGECHDVINMYAKYGAVPQNVYTGLHYGTSKNKFGEMQAVLKGMLDAIVKNPNGKLTPVWKKAFQAVLDTYLGEIPETFTYEGRESTAIIDNALKNGFTVAWAADVSEKSFSWKNGVAYIPEKEWDEMDDTDKKYMFDGPKAERKITPEIRQASYDNYETTDDHGMHIVGLAKDQTGREYYIVKNSWGEKNDYKGYIYVTKTYVLYKTTAILLHKDGIPKDLRNKMSIY